MGETESMEEHRALFCQSSDGSYEHFVYTLVHNAINIFSL